MRLRGADLVPTREKSGPPTRLRIQGPKLIPQKHPAKYNVLRLSANLSTEFPFSSKIVSGPGGRGANQTEVPSHPHVTCRRARQSVKPTRSLLPGGRASPAGGPPAPSGRFTPRPCPVGAGRRRAKGARTERERLRPAACTGLCAAETGKAPTAGRHRLPRGTWAPAAPLRPRPQPARSPAGRAASPAGRAPP